jgi:HK97 family phage major capsid protein
MTAPSGVTTASFKGVLTPAQVWDVLNLLIGGAPFSGSLTRAQSRTGRMAFPTVGPTGWAWLKELQQFPTISLGDDSQVVVAAKVGGILLLSNELRDDSTVNISNQLGTMLQDSLSRELDEGILNGSGDPEPNGIVAQAAAVDGADLLTAALTAVGQITDAGGSPNTIALSGSAFSSEAGRVDGNGQLVHPGGSLADVAGLKPVTVPGLANPLVYDSRRVFLVLGQDSNADISNDFAFDHDAVAIRVKARVNVAAPDKAKAIRKLTVTAPGP